MTDEENDQTIAVTASNASPDGKNKPILTIEGQIAHMKEKGIKFERCSEEEAAAYLREKTYFFKVYAYRKLYPKRVGGEHDGEYANLDFANLKELASLDQQLRYTLLPMTLDIEHFAKAKLMSKLTDIEADGCKIVSDYLGSLKPEEKARRLREIKALEHDPYCSGLVAKYQNGMPAWVFIELVSFGAFIDFYRYCSLRWGIADMYQQHYLLRYAKTIRNACAHSSCILNGITAAEKAPRTQFEAYEAIARTGVSKSSRKAQMRNRRIQQITMTIYAYRQLVAGNTSRQATQGRIDDLTRSFKAAAEQNSSDTKLCASFGFLEKMFDKLGK